MGSPAMTPDRKSHMTTPHEKPGQGDPLPARPSASVVELRRPLARRLRRGDDGTETARGQILLFTGVRYERMPEPAAALPLQRRRS